MTKHNKNLPEVPKVSEQDLTLADQSLMNAAQLGLIYSPTPKKFVKSRPAKGGGTWDFVSVGYVTKIVNVLSGYNSDFEFELVLPWEAMVACKQVVVKGRLTVDLNGTRVVKEQIGRKDVMFKKGTQTPLDFGNDMKAAASDAFKKCASMFGICADIYHREEFKQLDVQPEGEQPSQEEQDNDLLK